MRKEKMAILQKSLATDNDTLTTLRVIYKSGMFTELHKEIVETAENIKKSIAQTKQEIRDVKHNN